MRRVMILLCLALLSGCATGGAIRELSMAELEVIEAVSQRLEDNEAAMEGAARSLGELGAEYAAMEFEVELALTKAKRLESMTAAWASPSEDFVATQRAVVLYHLYELELAESKLLEARMEERRAAAQEVLDAYRRLGPLLQGAADNLEVILEYINQPKSASIQAFTQTFLSEVSAFRARLEASESPRLHALADKTARYEVLASQAKERASAALDAIMRARGN